jgi:hypothetical protein
LASTLVQDIAGNFMFARRAVTLLEVAARL